MADLRVDIKEFITLHGDKYDSLNTLNISGIDEISKRVVTIPSGSEKEIMSITGSISSGTYINGDVRYMRFTNLGSSIATGSVPVILTFKNESNNEFAIKVDEGYSYLYPGVSGSRTNGGVINTMIATGSSANIDSTFGDLKNITAKSSGSSNCTLEMFIASK